MNPAATNHTVSTRHDLELAQRYVAYRNAVLWPTRKLQRLLLKKQLPKEEEENNPWQS